MAEAAYSAEGVQRRKPISVKQQRALDVLLVGGTDQQAADSAGVSRSTVTKWRNNPESSVAAELELQREEMRRRQTARLTAAGSLAVRALEDTVKDAKNPSARVSAARTIMDQSQKASETEELGIQQLEGILDKLQAGLDRFEYERALQVLEEDPPDGKSRRHPKLKRLAGRRLEALKRDPEHERLRQTQSVGGVVVLPVKEVEPDEDPTAPQSGSEEEQPC